MEAIFLKIFNISITASWLILAILTIRFLLKKAPKSFYCVLWGIVGLRLIFPFSIQSVFSLIPSASTIQSNYHSIPTIETGIPVVDTNINKYIESTPLNESLFPNIIFNDIINQLSLIWIIGIILLFIYSFISYIRLYHKVRISLNVKDNIYYCDSIDSPFILGIFNPKIYIPSYIDENQIQYIIAHEKAHLQRKDHYIKPLGFLLLTIYWFNPMIWIAYIYLCRDIESACDEKVIYKMNATDKKGYSETLFACSIQRNLIMACPLAFGEIGVKERIKSILDYKKPSFWMLCISIVVCICLSVGFLTEPKSTTNGKITDFNFKIDNKYIVLDNEGQEEVIKLLDNFKFGNETNTSIIGDYYSIEYKKDGKKYSWSIAESGVYLTINDGLNIKYKYKSDTTFINEFIQIEQNQEDNIYKFDIDYNKIENLINIEILNHQNLKSNGTMDNETHAVLATSANYGSTNISIKKYMLVSYQHYDQKGGKPIVTGSTFFPAIITINIDKNENYKVVQYWQSNKNDFTDDIKKNFPNEIVEKALRYEYYKETLENENIQIMSEVITQMEKANLETKRIQKETYSMILKYNNGYTDEDYKKATGEECLHDRGHYVSTIAPFIDVYIMSDPHRLYSYIVQLYNVDTNKFENIYVNEDDYIEIQDKLIKLGYQLY